MTEFVSSISTLNILIQNIQNNQIQTSKAGQQVSTGFVSADLSDISQRSTLLNLNETLSQTNYYQTAINTVIPATQAMDTALTRISTDITSVKEAIQSYGPNEIQPNPGAIQQAITQAVNDITTALNQRQNGVYLFAGNRYQTQPISANGILFGNTTNAAITNIVAGSGGNAPAVPPTITIGTSQQQVGQWANTALAAYPVTNATGQVADYDTQATIYGAVVDPLKLATKIQSVTVENQRSVSYGITSNDQIFQDLANGLRAAYIGSGQAAGVTTATAQQGWLDWASATLTDVQSRLNSKQALLGLQQQDMNDTLTRHQTDASNVSIQITQIQDIDQASASSSLLALQTQFQASLKVTSTILGLSLSSYLR